MNRQHTRFPLTAKVAGTVAAIALNAIPLGGQSETLASVSLPSTEPSVQEKEETALERGRFAVLIDLDENRLYFKQGDLTLWSAPVGTGTGLRVITHAEDWDFSTPTGRFQVQYKERNPVWIAPDWYFVENNLPVPPRNHSSRYMEGTLGEAAVYIAPDLAIHGTDKPELIGQRVSHGCIRLENRYAMRLYHNVQVGTEVIIVGGEEVRENARVVDLRKGYDPSLASKGGGRKGAVDEVYERWRKMETDELIDVLQEQLTEHGSDSRWDQVAILLVNRVAKDDEEALGALLSLSGSLPTEAIEREWGTLLGEVYRRSPVSLLKALTRLDADERSGIADILVNASMTLYAGEFDTPSAPWPTSRIPRNVIPRGAEAAWEALADAERRHRDKLKVAAAEE